MFWKKKKDTKEEEEMHRGYAALTDRDLDRAAILSTVLGGVDLEGLSNLSPLNEYFTRLSHDASQGPQMRGSVEDLIDLMHSDLFAVRRGLEPQVAAVPKKKKGGKK